MLTPPDGYSTSPHGVAISDTGAPWICSDCDNGAHRDAGCPGHPCLCGRNRHGDSVVSIDGGVSLMPEFRHLFEATVRGSVVISADPLTDNGI